MDSLFILRKKKHKCQNTASLKIKLGRVIITAPSFLHCIYGIEILDMSGSPPQYIFCMKIILGAKKSNFSIVTSITVY